MPAPVVKTKNEMDFSKVTNALKAITKEPEIFLTVQPKTRKDIQALLQKVYKLAYNSNADIQLSREILPDLVLQGMDEEQIWQQIEIRNHLVMQQQLDQLSTLLALNEEKLEIKLKEEHEDEEDVEDEAEDEDLNESDDESIEEEMTDEDEVIGRSKKSDKTQKKNTRKSIVDDKFFKLDEMEEFLEAEEAKEMRKQNRKSLGENDDGIDYFDENLGGYEEDDDDDGNDKGNPNYKDFFDPNEENLSTENQSTGKENTKPNKINKKSNEKVNKNDESDDDDNEISEDENEDEPMFEENEENLNGRNAPIINKFRDTMLPASDSESQSDKEEEKPKSTFEQRQERLEQRIRDYEAEVLGEKPWQMKGEIQAGSRPKNSLLEEILEFDSTVRPPPVITEETTRCLEDIIRQRIKDEAWDDVVRTVKPVQTPQDFRKQLVLDQEKSKESLAQIYEKDYQRQLDKLNPQRTDATDEPIPKEHQEIRKMMHTLFIKLDALSNFHFTPKPVAPELKIITNTPAVNMEEVAPVAVSDAKLLAPEEIYRGPKHELIGKSERTRTDKNRALRKKKQKQRAIHKILEAKDDHKQKLGIPLGKKQENAKLLKQITRHRNVEKVTASTDHAALKSSKSFFSKLQDNSHQLGKANGKSTKKKADTKEISAKKLKL